MTPAKKGDDLFERALNRLEQTPGNQELWRLYYALKHAPVPVVMYDIDGTITWANRAMLGVFFGLSKRPSGVDDHQVFGTRIEETFPEYLRDYVLKENARVWRSQRAQVEKDWSDEEWVDIVWDVVRYPVNDTKIVAILVPKDDATVVKCQNAARA